MAQAHGGALLKPMSADSLLRPDAARSMPATKKVTPPPVNGPSLIIAYAPCINHGINMGLAQAEIKKAVECGYWTIYRYNPELAEQGKNPLTLDSKEPKAEGYQDFIKGEVRYASLAKLFPDVAQDLFNKNEADAMAKYAKYKRLAE